MTYEVTLETPRDMYTFTVNEAEFTDDMNGDALIMFRGLDPYDCPEPLRDEFQFHSKNLTATLKDNSIIEELTVKPTTISTHESRDNCTRRLIVIIGDSSMFRPVNIPTQSKRQITILTFGSPSVTSISL